MLSRGATSGFAIRSATVLSNGRRMFLEIPDLQPVNQLHLHVAVGRGETHDIFATVHALAKPFDGIRNYREATRPIAAHPIERDIAMMKAAIKNPWLAKVDGARPLTVEAASNLAYKTPELRARTGGKLALKFVNPDVVPHNWVLVRPGTLATVGTLADGLIADPEAMARHYVPDTAGRYPFLCTFPGHWKLMNSVMIVE